MSKSSTMIGRQSWKGRPVRLGLALALLALALPSAADAQTPAPAKRDGWITLGTQGGPQPNPHRGQPANLFLRGENVLLVDAGDGASERLVAAGVQLSSVRGVFLSHLHFDHSGGLFALLGLRHAISAPGVITIYGPPRTKELVNGIVAAMRPARETGYGATSGPASEPMDGIQVVELRQGDKVTIGDVTVRVAENSHYGFAPDDPKAGWAKSLSYRFESPERTVVYTGDTGPSEAVAELARGADLLVTEVIEMESTLAQIKRQVPNLPAPAFAALESHLRTHHLTPEQVGALAKAAHVGKVVLTHQLPGGNTEAATASLRDGVKRVFDGPVAVAADLDRF